MKKVIYTDKDRSSLREVQSQLQQKFNVQVCKSGFEAMMALDKEHIDLAMLDLELIEGTPASVFPLLKKNSKNKNVQLLALDSTKKNYLQRSLGTDLPDGIDGVIYRPFEVPEMVSEISLALAKSENKSKADKQNQSPSDSEESQDHSLIEQVNQYQIIEELGQGGNSSVFLAVDKSNKKENKVALKLYKPLAYQIVNSSLDAFFLREAYGLSKLDHPNVVKMLDFGKFKKSYYLVMELVNGGSLESIVKHHGALDEALLILIAGQVCSVLMYLQNHNIVHRDIKPANILLESYDQIKLTDFGASKQQDDNSLTRNNDVFMGTPQFVSPEQIFGETDLDILCDVYSLGATLYFCGTNTMPFTGKDNMEILYNNANEDPILMNELNPEISDEFTNLVAKLLSKKKKDRCTPEELIDILSIEV